MWEAALDVAGVIGTAVAIYEFALLRESRLRRKELQYLLAGIHSTANGKKMAWERQAQLLMENGKPQDLNAFRVYVKAADEFNELASNVSSLEGSIDSEFSAITDMMEKYLKIVKKGQEIAQFVKKDVPAV